MTMMAQNLDMAAAGRFQVQLGDFRLDLSVGAPAGEVLTLFGPSGAGKTTALRAMAGLVRPDWGYIRIGERIVYRSAGYCYDDGHGGDGDVHGAGGGLSSSSQSPSPSSSPLPAVWEPPHRRGVGYVTQQNHLFPHLTVWDNIAYGLRRRRSAAVRQRVAELIDALHLDGLAGRRVSELSGGQQQRTALARALAPAPRLLLLDEPFASLDMELRRELAAELRAMVRRLHTPAILVTHSREEALALADTVQVIDRGRTISIGPPLSVLEQPGQGRVAQLVGVENRLAMRVIARLPQDGTMVCRTADGISLGDSDNDGGSMDIVNSGVGNSGGGSPGHTLETPLADGLAVGDAVTVGIRASDIILASGPLPQSSARNTWAGVVSGVALRPPGYEVALDCGGLTLRCHITGASLEAMGIAPGLELWAIFKASSCFLLSDGAHTATLPALERV